MIKRLTIGLCSVLVVLVALTLLTDVGHRDEIAEAALHHQLKKLSASDAQAVDNFGISVAASSDAIGASGTGPNVVPDRYIVTLRNGVSSHFIGSLVNLNDDATVIHIYEEALNGFAGSFSKSVADDLEDHPFVTAVEADQLVTLAEQTLPTGIQRISGNENANSAIDGNDNKADIDIAVIDTGVDLDHPDLNVAGGFASYATVSSASALCGANNDSWDDGNGHGTHVSGTIAARDNNFGVVGLVPGARVWAVRVLSRRGQGCLSDVIAGIDWVTANADTIEVANMSLSIGGTSSGSLCNAINGSVNAGVFYAVAAGNSARDASGSSPANCSSATTVSAIVDTDGAPGGLGVHSSHGPDDSFARFSNFGSFVDIAAPGVSIYSTHFGGGYAYKSGTSMASPHVAGAAALHILRSSAPTDAAGVQAVNDALVAAASPQAGPYGATGDPDAYPEPVLCLGSSCTANPPPTSTPADTPVPPTPDGSPDDTDSDEDGLTDHDEIATYGTDPFDADTDGDGCGDGREILAPSVEGGGRDPLNPWDFYDAAGPGGGPGDGIIDLANDIFGVLQHIAPAGTEPAYDVNYDRGPSLGPNAWNMTAPDGAINLLDILGVIMQYQHDCR